MLEVVVVWGAERVSGGRGGGGSVWGGDMTLVVRLVVGMGAGAREVGGGASPC